jgi:hypothetical protein
MINQLPELPRVLKKNEAKITPKILAYFQEKYPFSVALEIKTTKTNSIPRSALLPHQLNALIAVRSEKGLTYKIPDASHLRLPFDAFSLKQATSFVVACFQKHNTCLVINPEKWNGANISTPCEFKFTL